MTGARDFDYEVRGLVIREFRAGRRARLHLRAFALLCGGVLNAQRLLASRAALTAVALVAVVAGTAHSRPYDWALRMHEAPRLVVADARGDVAMTASKHPTRARGWEEIVRVDGRTGRPRWHHRIRGTGPEAGSTAS